METTEAKDSVRVAVNVRPLITVELQDGRTNCVTITPGEPQVQIGPHCFTFDHVYGNSGPPSSLLFEQCVHPLIDALFSGCNATVLAYGQTGSGKTYTMGTDYSGKGNCRGIIPQVMETIFRKVEALKDGAEFLIRVSFIEVFKEEVFDLLDSSNACATHDSVPVAKSSARARVPIQIRETASGGITLAGVTAAEVKSKDEMASYLICGSSSRATASTNMNRQSSRSHAIFTIYVEQKKTSGTSDKSAGSDCDILSSKFHLVDLAGCEGAKCTGAVGHRLKEGILINKGLLALGNVISALGDEKKRKAGAFVGYRGSKLTRLLQDSLGGNSKTVMIACISAADINAEETTNTLRHASRARNIQNKAVVNRDPATAEMQKLSQLEQLQTKLFFSHSGSAVLEELQLLQKKVSLLELENSGLSHKLKEGNGKSWDAIENVGNDQINVNLANSSASKEARIQEVESKFTHCQAMCNRITQEKELLEKHNVWLDEELKEKVKNFADLRKTNMDEEARMSARIAELEREISESSSSLRRVKERIFELEQRVSSMGAELSTIMELAEGYKESSEEWSKKAGELEGGYKEKLEKETLSRRDLEKEAANLKQKLEKCELDLENTRKSSELSLIPLTSVAAGSTDLVDTTIQELPVSDEANDTLLQEWSGRRHAEAVMGRENIFTKVKWNVFRKMMARHMKMQGTGLKQKADDEVNLQLLHRKELRHLCKMNRLEHKNVDTKDMLCSKLLKHKEKLKGKQLEHDQVPRDTGVGEG